MRDLLYVLFFREFGLTCKQKQPALHTMRNLLYVLLFLAVAFLVVADYSWLANNPLANPMTCYTHLSDVIHFRTLPEFQPRP